MAPKTETPADALAALFARRAELVDAARDAEWRSRVASDDLVRARAAVEQTQRAVLSGDADDAALADAEAALAEARDIASAPWQERASGTRSAIRDVEKQINEHVATHFAQLAGEYNADAEAAAARVTDALRALSDAITAREQLTARAAELWQQVARPTPHLTPASRCEAVARQVDEVLASGGEAAPTMPLSFLPPEAEVEVETLPDTMSDNPFAPTRLA